MVRAYCKCMSPNPQRATLCRKRLREQVDGATNWRVHGDFRITWRFDRRVDDKTASEPGGQRAGAPLAHLGDAGGHAEPLERGDLMLKTTWQDPLERGEVGRHVERETVRRDAARDAHADRRDLRGPSVR